jgi:hypothetical protein
VVGAACSRGRQPPSCETCLCRCSCCAAATCLQVPQARVVGAPRELAPGRHQQPERQPKAAGEPALPGALLLLQLRLLRVVALAPTRVGLHADGDGDVGCLAGASRVGEMHVLNVETRAARVRVALLREGGRNGTVAGRHGNFTARGRQRL